MNDASAGNLHADDDDERRRRGTEEREEEEEDREEAVVSVAELAWYQGFSFLIRTRLEDPGGDVLGSFVVLGQLPKLSQKKGTGWHFGWSGRRMYCLRRRSLYLAPAMRRMAADLKVVGGSDVFVSLLFPYTVFSCATTQLLIFSFLPCTPPSFEQTFHPKWLKGNCDH